MSDRDAVSPTRRQPPSEKRLSNEMLPPMAADLPNRLRMTQDGTQVHLHAMQQPTGHAQQAPDADETEQPYATEWHETPKINAGRRLITQGREQDPSQLPRGTSIHNLLAAPEGKVVRQKAMLDALSIPQPDCCPSPKPMDMDDGSWICLQCGTSSKVMDNETIAALANLSPDLTAGYDQANVAVRDTNMPPLLGSCCLMPFRKTADQEQILCDSCGQVYFDDTENTGASYEMGSAGSTFRATKSWRRQNSGALAIMDQADFYDPPVASGVFRHYSLRTQSSFSSSTNYQPTVDMPGPRSQPDHALSNNIAGSSNTRPAGGLRRWREERLSSRAISALPVPTYESDSSSEETPKPDDKQPTVVSNVPTRIRQPSLYEPACCIICKKQSLMRNTNCPLCHRRHCDNHTPSECEAGKPKFHRFMDLALELRERIYAFTLDTDQPIQPHLCDYPTDEAIQFHDDSQKDHFATSDLFGITRVSKKIRAESFPIFYSVNTFAVGPDTTTYFDRLAYLGRFDLIRHVRFSLGTRKESMSPSILRRMNQYIKEADAFQKTLQDPVGQHLSSLKNHPQYIYGGVSELNTLITLMKLTSPLASQGKSKGKASDAPFHSKLVVPVSIVSGFISYDPLKWFPTVMYGLGIQLHYVNNVDFSSVPGNRIEITWRQRFQKKDFGDIPDYVNPIDSSGQTAAYKRALELDPELEQRQRPKAWAYLRTSCVGGNLGWFDIPTEGGGVGY